MASAPRAREDASWFSALASGSASPTGHTLPHTIDSYSSVTVSPLPSEISEAEFERRMRESCDVWRRRGHKGVFLELDVRQANLIPIAVRLGFRFHLARNNTGLILSLWLPEGVPNNLPSGPSHFLGVAALVVRDSDKRVLVVQEKTGPAAKYKVWKLPGGQANIRESIEKAAIREVFEETGVRTTFRSLASILHLQSNKRNLARAGHSDVFCTCILDAKDPEPVLKLQENEIKAAKWVNVEELTKLLIYSAKNTAFRRSVEAAVAIIERGHSMSSHNGKSSSQVDGGLLSEMLPLGFGKNKKIDVLRARL